MNKRSIFDHIFTTQCVLCGSPATTVPNLCDPCVTDLPVLDGTHCPRCARPMAGNVECGDCQQRKPAFSGTFAALRYEREAVPLIHAFKFRGDLSAGLALSHLMLRHLPGHTPRPDCLVPVPLHRRRLNERGFNQSLEIARFLGRVLHIPVRYRMATRVRDRPPQSSLTNWAGRWQNVDSVFHVKPDGWKGRQMAIVDDVMTSGATASALARCLKQTGAERVVVWVAARAG